MSQERDSIAVLLLSPCLYIECILERKHTLRYRTGQYKYCHANLCFNQMGITGLALQLPIASLQPSLSPLPSPCNFCTRQLSWPRMRVKLRRPPVRLDLRHSRRRHLILRRTAIVVQLVFSESLRMLMWLGRLYRWRGCLVWLVCCVVPGGALFAPPVEEEAEHDDDKQACADASAYTGSCGGGYAGG
jgi:hypothetical protein